MADPKIIIKGTAGQDIDLGEFKFENFRYIEDMNLGFPTIEFALRDHLFELLRKNLFGDEELIIQDFVTDQFKFDQKSFRIKLIGSLGSETKPGSAQTVKLIAIDKNYDAILKNTKSIFFKTGEVKKISDLLWKLLNQVGIANGKTSSVNNFNINITDTSSLIDQGFGNLFIPYSKDPMKIMRKLCNYAITSNGTGGFLFFINRRGLNFVPISSLFINTTENSPSLQITDWAGLTNVRLSTFNAFSNFMIGHEKKIMGFNLLEKDYNTITYSPNAKYIEYSEYDRKDEKDSNVQTMSSNLGNQSISMPFSKDFVKGNIKVYYTPIDNPLTLKGFSDRLYYSQMFNYVLEINTNMAQKMPDFAIGEMVNIQFKTTDADSWESLNGGWLLKSFAYTYPGDNCLLKLTRIGIGALPDQYIKKGE